MSAIAPGVLVWSLTQGINRTQANWKFEEVFLYLYFDTTAEVSNIQTCLSGEASLSGQGGTRRVHVTELYRV